jgi:peptidoglycan/xylan/chitin deacetylase (PgdA/CDA1 family)
MKTVFLRLFFLFLVLVSCKSDATSDSGEKPVADSTSVKKDSVAIIKTDSLETPLSFSDSTVYLYLSFDDGPNNGTLNLLKILDEYDVPSSLFIVGKHVYGSRFQQNLFRNYANYTFIELCNHSWSHANDKYKAYYENPLGVVEDFKQCHDSLKFNNKISRSPGKNMWSIEGDSSRFRTKSEVAKQLTNAGFQMIGWDVDWDFNKIKDHKQFLQRLIEIEKSRYPKQFPAYQLGHIVVLMHDQSFCDSTNCAELTAFLKTAKSIPGKYKFKKISEYPLLQQSVQ